MPSIVRIVSATGALAVLVALTLYIEGNAAARDIAPLSETELGNPERIARGEYLALAGNCSSCHTAPGGEYLAGGLAFETPFGRIYSTNITPHTQSGIGEWSLEEFYNSMHHGTRPDGEHLYPVFPYTAFTRLTQDDIASLYAFLRAAPAVDFTPPKNTMPFPFRLRPLLAFWKALFFTPGEFVPDDARSADWNRGAYLVEGLAHCSACHSPRNALGAEQRSLAMSGGVYLHRVAPRTHRSWSAPNLTSSPDGLALWPDEELAAYLKTARNSFLESFGPMNEVIMNSTRHLDTYDINAMVHYLKSLPPVTRPPPAAPDALTMGRGRTVYNLHCGTCHLPTGEGDPDMAPRLNGGSLVVQAANPASMINLILYSPEPPHPPLPEKWRKPMEDFQYQLDDEEVAAVASFVRNSWGNRAGAVSPAQVAQQR